MLILCVSNKGIKNVFTGIIDFIVGVFTGDWERAWNGVKKVFTGIINGIIGVFESMVNFVIRGINKLIGGLDGLVNKAGSVIGLDIHIPKIPEIKIPRLAKGAVIPIRTLILTQRDITSACG